MFCPNVLNTKGRLKNWFYRFQTTFMLLKLSSTYFFKIYLRTAALCSSKLWLNWLKPVPSILETK